MKKTERKNIKSSHHEEINPSINNLTKKNVSDLELFDKLKKESQEMTYEDLLQKLDSILDCLHSDNVALEKIEEYYLKGKIYLEQCEKLLDKVEIDLIKFDINNLDVE